MPLLTAGWPEVGSPARKPRLKSSVFGTSTLQRLPASTRKLLKAATVRRGDGVACCCLGSATRRRFHWIDRQIEVAHRMVAHDQDLSYRLWVQRYHQRWCSMSLSVRTLRSDYRVADLPDASGPIVYVVDSLRGNGLGAHRWLSKYLTRKVYGRRERTTSWSSKGSHRMFHFKSKHTTQAESLTR